MVDRRIGAMMARNNRPDTAADIAWRQRHSAACAQANRETHERFPTLTAENIDAALTFQERRIRELMETA
jgi:hypothetical protein